MPPEPAPVAPAPEPPARRARDAWTAAACVAAGLAFGGLVWARRGPELAQQYLAGYLIELGLSVDNVFVFALVFQQFGVGPRRQRRLLLWGVCGAIVMRLAFLAAGLGALRRFSWLIPALGVFILATGLRLAFARRGRKAFDPGSPFFRWVLRRAPPALAAIVVLELADLVFALDSLPAVLAVTHDGFVAVSSNLFAILGLRSLFFVVTGALGGLRHLGTGIAVVLCLVGAKMLAEPWFAVPTLVSLGVIGSVLAVAAAASLWGPRSRR